MVKRQDVLIFAALAVFLFVVFYFFRGIKLQVDEMDNYPQIINFINLNFTLGEISAVPGYHALVAVIAKLFGCTSVGALRAISLVFSFLSVVVFYFIAGKLSGEPAFIKTLHYFFLPILFIFFFLLYTDVLSLLLVLLTFLLVLKKQYHLAGVAGILSMAVRQNNVMWLGFFVLYIFFENYSLRFSTAVLKEYFKKIWVFVLAFMLFVVFVYLNGGVAVGDAKAHPAFKLSAGNIYFFLFCFFFILLPLNIYNLTAIWRFIKSNKIVFLLLPLLYIVYLFTFQNDHPYNNIAEGYFIRNKILTYVNSGYWQKSIFFIPVACAALSICVTPLLKSTFFLLYPFTILFLLPSWLIEPRYYLIPFVLFLLCRKSTSKLVDYSTIVYFIVWTAIIFRLVRNGVMFI